MARHRRAHCARIALYLGRNRPAVARNPSRCSDLQSRCLGTPSEKARLVVYSYPVITEKKRDPEHFDATQDNLKRLQAAALADQLSLFYLDESGFSTIPNVQRAWAPKGKPHVADASSCRQRVNVIGALEFNTGRLWYDLHGQAVKRPHVTELIDRIARREQRMPLTGKFQASCRLTVKILSSYFLLVINLLGGFVLGFGMIGI
ncbi:transposase [Methylomonas fluvii]|uniref:Transposase n=1 Tax=Methylomonas fluvii TaxID=1854564 RepID=A0ABR9DFR1_9GAMM|nr:transposase [Methylomonas fluvii]MBD9361933.1 transposase [Methylomonas fluvii]